MRQSGTKSEVREAWMVKKLKRISVMPASLSERGWKSLEYRALHVVLGMSSHAVLSCSPPQLIPVQSMLYA